MRAVVAVAARVLQNLLAGEVGGRSYDRIGELFAQLIEAKDGDGAGRMVKRTKIPKSVSVALALLGGVMGLLLVTLSMDGVPIQAAPLGEGTGSDPRIESVKLTSDLPISDTHPGDGVSKLVYVSNRQSGAVTATLVLTGTPALTLTTDAAFDKPSSVLTSSVRPITFALAYEVAPTHTTQSDVWYTVTNSSGQMTGITLTFVSDVTAPVLSAPAIIIVLNDDAFAVSGTSLYYTNTLEAGSFMVRGSGSDGLSGLDVAAFSQAFGQTPSPDTTPGLFTGVYDVAAGATESGTITATVSDKVANTAAQTYTYALDGTPPTSTSSAPVYANDGIDVAWVATDMQSGVFSTTLWYKKGVVGTWTSSQTIEADSGTFAFAPPDGDGVYLFATVAADNLGNLEAGPSVSETQTLYDATPPVSVTVDAPTQSSTGVFTVSWSAEDTTSGVVSYTIEYSRTSDTVWQEWMTSTSAASMTFTAPTTDTTYTFRVTAYDLVGNSADATATTRVGDHQVFMPLASRNYSCLVNGGFESGLNGWVSGRGPFNGHGTGLPQSALSYAGSQQALLGDRAASNGGIRVGYGYLAQTFAVEKRYLRLQYHVFSYDIVRSSTSDRYFDTFEVSIDKPPAQIANGERNSRGCTTTNLNPTGTLVVPAGGALAFCGGRSGSSSVVGTQWDSGSRTVTLDMSAYRDESITLYVAIWSREYDLPFYNDQGWYNTWAYVDNVSLEETDSHSARVPTHEQSLAGREGVGSTVVPGLAAFGIGVCAVFGPVMAGRRGKSDGTAGPGRQHEEKV